MTAASTTTVLTALIALAVLLAVAAILLLRRRRSDAMARPAGAAGAGAARATGEQAGAPEGEAATREGAAAEAGGVAAVGEAAGDGAPSATGERTDAAGDGGASETDGPPADPDAAGPAAPAAAAPAAADATAADTPTTDPGAVVADLHARAVVLREQVGWPSGEALAGMPSFRETVDDVLAKDLPDGALLRIGTDNDELVASVGLAALVERGALPADWTDTAVRRLRRSGTQDEHFLLLTLVNAPGRVIGRVLEQNRHISDAGGALYGGCQTVPMVPR